MNDAEQLPSSPGSRAPREDGRGVRDDSQREPERHLHVFFPAKRRTFDTASPSTHSMTR